MKSCDSNLKRQLRRIVPSAVWDVMRRTKAVLKEKKFDKRWVSHNYHDQTLRVFITDGVAEAWYDHDWPRQVEIDQLMQAKLRPGATVYDCGAHQCVVALVLAGIVGPAGRVVAVETELHNVEAARANIAANAAGRAPVDLLHAGVAATDGTLRFNNDFNEQAHAGRSAISGLNSIPAVTLSTLAKRYPKPDVIFIDIEGAEAMALQGSADVFHDGNRPCWFVEVHSKHGLETLGGSVDQIVRFFTDHAYRLEWANPDDAAFQPLSIPPTGRFFLIARDV
jgi:FkbM family methyltransferase